MRISSDHRHTHTHTHNTRILQVQGQRTCCRLIDAAYGRHKFHGILSLLDDATLRPTPPSDFEWGKTLKKFSSKFEETCCETRSLSSIEKSYEGDKRKTAKEQARIAFNGKAFWIDHYAGPVGYSTVGFLSKNLDKMPEQFTNMLLCSNDSSVCLDWNQYGVGDPLGLFNILDVKQTVQTKHKTLRETRKEGTKIETSFSEKQRKGNDWKSISKSSELSCKHNSKDAAPLRTWCSNGVRARSARISIISLTSHTLLHSKTLKIISSLPHTLCCTKNTQTSNSTSHTLCCTREHSNINTEHRYDAFNRTI